MEFTKPVPLGAQASLMANTLTRKPPDSSKVETAADAGKARADMHNSTKQSAPFAERKTTLSTSPKDEIRPDTLAGPPPSFQINVLEMDQQLQQKLARIETDRAHAQQDDRSVAMRVNDDGPDEMPGA